MKLFYLLIFICPFTLFSQEEPSPIVNPTPVFVEPKENIIYEKVDEDASYPGGIQEFRKYIMKNLRYPGSAIVNDIQGIVELRFVVGKQGHLSNIEVVKGVDDELDKEAIRLVKMMPRWIAGKIDGKVVDSYVRLPIRFKLD